MPSKKRTKKSEPSVSRFYARLKDCVTSKGWTMNKFHYMCDLAPSQFSNWKTGQRRPSDNDLIKMAAVKELGVTLEQLRGWRLLDTEEAPSLQTALEEMGAYKPEGLYRFPCLGVVSAGPMAKADWDPEDPPYYEFVDVKEYSDDLFCLKIQGDSMEPLFIDGGLLLLRPAKQFRDKGFYVFKSEDGNASFKVLRFDQSGSKFQPLNKRYKAIPIDEHGIESAFEVIEYKLSFL